MDRAFGLRKNPDGAADAVAAGSVRQNLIVAALPDDERFRLARTMEPVELPARAAIDGGVFFPTRGVISVIVQMSDGAAVQCAAIGNEGWFGAEIFAGAAPGQSLALQQIAGAALRMSSADFAAAVQDTPRFAEAVDRFRGVLTSYAMQSSACNRLHDAVARCARWLLFTAERCGCDELPLTHDFVVQMLGASRSAVSATMSKLEQQRLIERSRAHVVIRDVDGLRRVACECQEALRGVYAHYTRSLGATSSPRNRAARSTQQRSKEDR